MGVVENSKERRRGAMKGSLIVVAFFGLGLFVGHSGCLPSWFMSSQTSFVALCALLLFVGMSIGLNPNMMRDIKSLSPRLALLPLVTILGSWMGAVVAYVVMSSDLCTLFQQRSLTSCLAVDSGFAYYSLSSIFITEYRGAELGTIALLANIVREMITLLLAPMLAKLFGPLAPITAGGATTMDTTLPIIAQASGQKYVALSIYHGFVTDFSVPFLVTMWCTIGA